MLKPRRLELGFQLFASLVPQLPHVTSRMPLLQGLAEEVGFHVMQICCFMVEGLNQPIAPQALARAAPPPMSQQCHSNNLQPTVGPQVTNMGAA